MVPGKKQLEKLLIHYFRASYDDFPRGIIIPSESPDFILKVKARYRVGIEITRLNTLNVKNPAHLPPEELLVRDRIIGLSEMLFMKSSSRKMFVKFLFSDAVRIEPERELSLVVRVVNGIRKAVRNKKSTGFFFTFVSAEYLPPGIESVLIAYHPSLDVSVWERTGYLEISENVIDDINQVIEKKENKLWLYRKQNLNVYWLIIIADQLTRNHHNILSGKILTREFNSSFGKVFLFDIIKSKVIYLL